MSEFNYDRLKKLLFMHTHFERLQFMSKQNAGDTLPHLTYFSMYAYIANICVYEVFAIVR